MTPPIPPIADASPALRVFRSIKHIAGCWVCPLGVGGTGYAFVSDEGGGLLRAHRLVYELLVGPIPAGFDLDHLCRVRNCVNPDHLEPVTRGENVARGMSPAAIARRTNTCARGHVNQRVSHGPGKRTCGACRLIKKGGTHASQR